MDMKLVEHYRGPQRAPVFIRRTESAPRKPLPFWAWACLAAAAGAAIVLAATAFL